MSVCITIVSEGEVQGLIPEIAKLRIGIFREFPYLYDGDIENEKQYLHKFINTPQSIISVIKDGDKIVGALTGLPLKYESVDIKAPWLGCGIDINDVFYISEALMFPQYRSKGFGKKLFHTTEKWIKRQGNFNVISFATIIRQHNHPLKPKQYRSPDSLWESLGYDKKDALVCKLSWREIGSNEAKSNPLVFWVKNI